MARQINRGCFAPPVKNKNGEKMNRDFMFGVGVTILILSLIGLLNLIFFVKQPMNVYFSNSTKRVTVKSFDDAKTLCYLLRGNLYCGPECTCDVGALRSDA